LKRDFAKIFPTSFNKKEFAWSGVFGKTKDSLPYIGNYSKNAPYILCARDLEAMGSHLAWWLLRSSLTCYWEEKTGMQIFSPLPGNLHPVYIYKGWFFLK
jgi:hypothetical protein